MKIIVETITIRSQTEGRRAADYINLNYLHHSEGDALM